MHARSALLVAGMMTALATAPLGSAAQCTSSANCHFWDDNYHEDVFFDWDTTRLDVLITPAVTPFALQDTAAIQQSIDAWEAGIQVYGSSWLQQELQINSYMLGTDVPPPDALADPEIIVALSTEFNPFVLFGVAVLAPLQFCHGLGLSADSDLPGSWLDLPVDWHQHGDSPWAVARAECQGGGVQCYVVNTNFLLGGVNRLYDLNAHEFGHCLGAGHVGDADVAPGEFNAKTIPTEDIMSYQYTPSQVHCVSNLNVRILEGVFAEVAGRPSSEWLQAGDFVHMSPSNYQQVDCANPSTDILGGQLSATPTLEPPALTTITEAAPGVLAAVPATPAERLLGLV